MLTLQQIKENPDDIVRRLGIKGFDGRKAIDDVLALDAERRALQQRNDTEAAELNNLAAQIGAKMKAGQKAEAEELKARVATIKVSQKDYAEKLAATEAKIREILLGVPNVP